MYRHLVQIAVLLMTYVTLNNALEEQCPPTSIKPVAFPSQYVMGDWRATHCITSPLCPTHMRCLKYHYNMTDHGQMDLYIRGYNEDTKKVEESKGTVKFTGRTGEFIVENLPGLKSAQFLMLHAERHFCIVYVCVTDENGVTSRAGFIGTKNDPENKLTEHELARAVSVCEKNKIPMSEFVIPSYHDCEDIYQMSAGPQAVRDISM